MTANVLFWVLMVIWAIFGFVTVKPKDGQSWNFGIASGSILLFVLLAIIGWKIFGAPVKGL